MYEILSKTTKPKVHEWMIKKIMGGIATGYLEVLYAYLVDANGFRHNTYHLLSPVRCQHAEHLDQVPCWST